MRDDSFVMKPIHWLVLVSALVVAVGLKAGLVSGGRVPFNADEAVVALMASHIMLGERPIFFYGQAYMGSLDAYLIAVGFSLFGEQVWVIRGIQVILYLGTLVTTAMLGRFALGSWRVGILAVWLLAIPSVNLTLYTTVSLGGYGEMLLIGNGILLVGLRIASDLSQFKPKQPVWTWMLLGFLIGLGLWTFGLTLVYSLPTLIFLSWLFLKNKVPRQLGREKALFSYAIILFGTGFFAGSLPWWLYAAQNGMRGLLSELSGIAISGVENTNHIGQLIQHTFNLVLFGGTVIAGMRPPWGIEWLAQPLLPVAVAFWIGVIVFTLRRLYWAASLPKLVGQPVYLRITDNQRSQKSSMITTHPRGSQRHHDSVIDPPLAVPGNQDGLILLAGVGLTLTTGFIATPFGADPSGRYFLPLTLIMSLFAALAVVNLRDSFGRWAWGLVVLILGFNLWGNLQAAFNLPPGLTTQFDAETRLDHRYDLDLVEFLETQGERRGYATYWISYPLAFQSREQLIFTPRLPYHSDLRYTARDDRYLPYLQEVAAAERVAYITANHPTLDNQIRDRMVKLGVSWREKVIGDYHIFYRLSQVIRPEQLGLGGQTD